MNRLSKALVFILTTLGSISAQGIAWNKFTTQEDVLEKARPLSSVVRIMPIEKTNSGIRYTLRLGSGVLISPKHVLTALHITIDHRTDGNPHEELMVYLEDDAGNYEMRSVIRTRSAIHHPGSSLTMDGLAILTLDAPVDSSRFRPSKLCRDSIETFCGEKMHGAGFGYQMSSYDHRHARHEVIAQTKQRQGKRETFEENPERSFYWQIMHRAYYETQCSMAGTVRCPSNEIAESNLYFWEKLRDWGLLTFLEIAYHQSEANMQSGGLVFLTSHLDGAEEKVPYEFEGMILSGDSGSPKFNEQDELVAITAASTSTEISVLSMDFDIDPIAEFSTPIFYYLDWIDGILDAEK